ncbi:hypothetical protein [Nonomuraea turcica]|uniref:hypothetical protein n=1 Tax=Nonomuraea sp. G32 TaxID=3067274 RepID=UPI00273CC739|nr:hypothetical protein [Nonomuraea sp. G32]MDP4510308.1 hypothetical protein [Nonomuraea sp. G32]
MTVTDVMTFVSQADEGTLDQLILAIQQRREVVKAIAAAALKEGDVVEIHSIKPAYLKGMRGRIVTIETIRKTRCARVALDNPYDRSTVRARRRQDPTDEPLTVDGIPLVCLRKTEE